MGEPSSAACPQWFACSPAVALTHAKPDAGIKPCKFSGDGQGGRQLDLEERRKRSTDPDTEEGEVAVRADFWCQLDLAWSVIQIMGFCQGSEKWTINQISQGKACYKGCSFLLEYSDAMSQRPTVMGSSTAGRVIACW